MDSKGISELLLLFLILKQKRKILLGACADTNSNSVVFDQMRLQGGDLFIHSGDFHYADISVNDTKLYNDAFENCFRQGPQKNFYKSIPVAYMWDDHDYGANNAAGDSPSKEAAIISYKNNVPHYPLGNVTQFGAIHQAFDIGKIRVIMTDLRSESYQKDKTIMSQQQKQWLFSEFLKFSSYSLLIWVSTQPWIGAPVVGEDSWLGFAEQRKEVANFISNNSVNNLILISGDAHMIAADDGTSSDYSDLGQGGFPVIHSGSIDRAGSTKGGPFSAGCFGYEYYQTMQYGVLTVDDNNGTVCVYFDGYREMQLTPIMQFKKCTPIVQRGTPGNGKDGICRLEAMPIWVWVVVVIAYVALFAALIVGFVWQLKTKALKIISACFALFILAAGLLSYLTPLFPLYYAYILYGILGIYIIIFIIVAVVDNRNSKTKITRRKV